MKSDTTPSPAHKRPQQIHIQHPPVPTALDAILPVQTLKQKRQPPGTNKIECQQPEINPQNLRLGAKPGLMPQPKNHPMHKHQRHQNKEKTHQLLIKSFLLQLNHFCLHKTILRNFIFQMPIHIHLHRNQSIRIFACSFHSYIFILCNKLLFPTSFYCHLVS